MQETCPECGSDNIKKDDDEIYCGDCGLVLNDYPLSPSSSMVDNKEFINTDTHHPPLDSMVMDLLEHDDMGSHIRDHRLSELQDESRKTSTSMAEGLDLLKRFRSQLQLPERVLYTAYRIYRRCVEQELLRGRDRKQIVLACLYRATLEEDVPRPLSMFEDKAIGENMIGRTYNTIKKELGLNYIYPKIEDCLDFVDVDQKIKREVREKLPYIGRRDNPWILTAAFICKVKNEPELKKDLCKKLGINKHYLNEKMRMIE